MKKFVLALSLAIVTAIACMCFGACEKVIAAESITLSEQTVTLNSKATQTLTYTAQPENATVKVEISDPTVVKYEDDTLTALTAGTATVKVYSTADSSVYAECTVKVNVPEGYKGVGRVGLDNHECHYVYPASWVSFGAEEYRDMETGSNVNLVSESKNDAYFFVSAETYKKAITDQYEAWGVAVTFTDCKVSRSDYLGFKRVHIVYDYSIATINGAFHQEQMILHSGEYTYILTVTNATAEQTETIFSEFVGR